MKIKFTNKGILADTIPYSMLSASPDGIYMGYCAGEFQPIVYLLVHKRNVYFLGVTEISIPSRVTLAIPADPRAWEKHTFSYFKDFRK